MKLNLITRNCLKCLGDETNLKILEYLYKFGTITHYLLESVFKKENPNEHFMELLRHGLIYEFYSENSFNKKYLHYEISKLGKLFLEHLSKFLEE